MKAALSSFHSSADTAGMEGSVVRAKTPVTPLQKTGTQKEKGFSHLSDGFQFDETVNV